jgi:hypothetical protein
MNLTRQQLLAELVAKPYELQEYVSVAKDRAFYCPDERWLKKYADWCRMRPVTYQAGKRDCDNISIQSCYEVSQAFQDADSEFDTDVAWFYAGFQLVPTSEYFKGVVGVDNFFQNYHVANAVRLKTGWHIYDRQANDFEKLDTLIRNNVIGELTFMLL